MKRASFNHYLKMIIHKKNIAITNKIEFYFWNCIY